MKKYFWEKSKISPRPHPLHTISKNTPRQKRRMIAFAGEGEGQARRGSASCERNSLSELVGESSVRDDTKLRGARSGHHSFISHSYKFLLKWVLTLFKRYSKGDMRSVSLRRDPPQGDKTLIREFNSPPCLHRFCPSLAWLAKSSVPP